MRVLLTGADGFLGAAIGARLAARDDMTLVRSRRRAAAGAPSDLAFDLRDPAAIEAALAAASPDVVVDAAGRTRGAPHDLLVDNALATANLAAAIGRTAPRARLILLGSAAQYGLRSEPRPWRETDPCLPQEPYGLSKQAAEQCAFAEARRRGLQVVSLRVFNVVAASARGGQVFASFLGQAAAGVVIRLGPLGGVRDFVDIADVARAVEAAIDRGVAGEAINVCAGLGRTVRELIDLAVAALDRPVRIEEAVGEGEPGWSVGDPAKCEATLGFRPSSDLGPLIGEAAAWVKGAADARSCA